MGKRRGKEEEGEWKPVSDRGLLLLSSLAMSGWPRPRTGQVLRERMSEGCGFIFLSPFLPSYLPKTFHVSKKTSLSLSIFLLNVRKALSIQVTVIIRMEERDREREEMNVNSQLT